MTFLLAEQNAAVVLRYSRNGCLIENDRVIEDGPFALPAADPEIKASYLGSINEQAPAVSGHKRWLA